MVKTCSTSRLFDKRLSEMVFSIRYGDDPNSVKPHFTYRQIAEFLGVNINSLKHHLRCYIHDIQPKRVDPISQMTLEQLDALVSASALKEQVHLTLRERLVRQRNIKMKVPDLRNTNPRKYSQQRLAQLGLELDQKLKRFERLGYEVIYIDECVFSIRNESMKKVWCQSKQQMTLQQSIQSKTDSSRAVMGAISEQSGYILSHMIDGYFNSKKTIEFIKELRKETNGRNIVIFWDNARIHRSKQVQKYLRGKGINNIFNVPYSPELNGIELLWSDLKRIFRKTVTHKKANNLEIRISDILYEIQKKYRNDKAKVYAKHGRCVISKFNINYH